MFKLVRFLKPYKTHVILGPLAKFADAAFELVLPLLMAQLIDVGIENNDKSFIIVMSVVMVVLTVAGFGLSLFCQYSAAVASAGMGHSIRHALLKKINRLSFSQLDGFGSGALSNRATTDVSQVQLGVAMFLRLVLRVPFICIGGIVMAVILDPVLSCILIVLIPFFVAIVAYIMKKTVPLYSKSQKSLDSISGFVREDLTGVRVVRAYDESENRKSRFSKLNDQWAKFATKAGAVAAILPPCTMLLMNIAVIAILWFGGVRIDAGMSAGKLIAFINYITQIMTAMVIFANLTVIFTRASASAARINEVLDIPNAMEEGTISGLRSEKVGIEFSDVSFAYGGNEDVLSHISFSLKGGGTLGIVGGIGSGKSTLGHLIAGFYRANRGQILLGDEDICNFREKFLRETVAVVPQKAQLFSGTLAENLRMARTEADEDELMAACETAQIAKFITTLPEGLNTRVAEGGTNFSGGQRQRLAIARAIAQEPKLLIMDDSASALDNVTDLNCRHAIRKKFKDTTLVIISQRISAVKDSDLILVLDNGSLIAKGRHDELLTSCMVYREINASQTSQGGAA